VQRNTYRGTSPKPCRVSFQRPRSLGIGLCFEDAPLDLELVDAVQRLTRMVGYFGLLRVGILALRARQAAKDRLSCNKGPPPPL
jgi:hypothetical protein